MRDTKLIEARLLEGVVHMQEFTTEAITKPQEFKITLAALAEATSNR